MNDQATMSTNDIAAQLVSQFKPEKASDLDGKHFLFNVTGDDAGLFSVLIKGNEAQLQKHEEAGESISPDVTLTISDADLANLVSGQLNPQMAFMVGKLKVQGDLQLATKLQTLFL